jgi:hypothetical protein
MKYKNFTYAWVKGRRTYLGSRRTRILTAMDLVLSKKIRLSKKDREKLDIKKPTIYELNRVSDYEWAELLEFKGWKWIKL